MMPFAQIEVFLMERSRSASHAHNQLQGLLKLPSEVRNYIYSLVLGGDYYIFKHGLFRRESATFDRFSGVRKLYNCNGLWYSQVGIPALFHVCQQLRSESKGMFFGNASLVIWLEHPGVRDKYSARDAKEMWCVDAFDDSGLSSLHRIEIRSDYECQDPRHRVDSAHYKGQSVTAQGSVKLTINRRTQKIEILSPYKESHDTYYGASKELLRGLVVHIKTFNPKSNEFQNCCRETAEKTVERLLANVDALDMHKSDHRLCKADLWELRRLMEGKLWGRPVVELVERNERWRWFWRGRDRRNVVRCHRMNRCHLG